MQTVKQSKSQVSTSDVYSISGYQITTCSHGKTISTSTNVSNISKV